MKRIFAFLTVITLIVLTIPAFAASDRNYIFDDAGLLNDSQKEQIQAKLDEISEKYKCDVVVVTTNTLDGKTLTAYADDFQDYNGYSDDGILLLVSMENREMHISTKGNYIELLPDKVLDYLADKIVPYLKKGDYYNVFDKYADSCDYLLKHNGKLPLSPLWYLASLVGGLIAALIGTGSMKSDLKTVEWKSAANYVKKGSLNITQSKDVFLYTHIDRRRKPEPTKSGGVSTHTSSSGTVHGGISRKF